MKNNFDDIIQEKVHNHESYVPADVWNNISRENRKTKRRIVFFWLAMGILLSTASIVGYRYYSNNNNHQIHFADKSTAPAQDQLTDHTSVSSEIKDLYDKKSEQQQAASTIADDKPASTTDHNTAKNTIEISGQNATAIQKVTPATAKSNTTSTIAPGNVDSQPNAKTANGNNSTARRKKQKTINNHAEVNISSPLTDEDIAQATNKSSVSPIESNQQIKTNNTEIAEVKLNKNATPVPVIGNNPAKSQANVTELKKIANTPDKKLPGKNKNNKWGWYADASVTAIFPTQQYDPNITFNRTLFSKDGKSTFTGKLMNSKLLQSQAYSVAIRKQLNNKLSLSIGFRYLQIKEKLSIEGIQKNTMYKYVDRLIDNANTTPTLVRDTIGILLEGTKHIDATNGYRFFGMPIAIQYNVLQHNKWSLSLAGGVQFNLFSNYRNEINRNSSSPYINSTQQTNTTNSLSASFFGSLRIGRSLNNRLEIFAAPSYTYTPGEQKVKNALINKKIQQPGFGIGVSYKLK